MAKPGTGAELRAASDGAYAALMTAIDALPPAALEGVFPFADRDRCVRDVVGHLHRWHLLFVGWYAAGLAGDRPDMPAPGHTWRALPALNREIWQELQGTRLVVARADLDATHTALTAMIARHDDADLYEHGRYPWTGSTTLGAYLGSATASHYTWALRKIGRYARTL